MKTIRVTESGGMQFECSATEAAAFRKLLEAVLGEPIACRLDMLGDLAPRIEALADGCRAAQKRREAAMGMRWPAMVGALQ